MTKPTALPEYARIEELVLPNGKLRISRSTFYALVAKGELPRPIKLGGRVSLWNVEAIAARLAQAERESVAAVIRREDGKSTRSLLRTANLAALQEESNGELGGQEWMDSTLNEI